MAPPSVPPELPDSTLRLTVADAPKTLAMPPPLWAALFPVRVQSLTVSVPPSFSMPPPKVAELPDRVLPVTVSVPKLRIAPPPLTEPAVAELPDRVLPVTVSVPLFSMPPPPSGRLEELPDTTLLLTVSVPWFRMPPRLPLATVSPDRLAVCPV